MFGKYLYSSSGLHCTTEGRAQLVRAPSSSHLPNRLPFLPLATFFLRRKEEKNLCYHFFFRPGRDRPSTLRYFLGLLKRKKEKKKKIEEQD